MLLSLSLRGACDSLTQTYDTLTEADRHERFADGYWNIYNDSGKLIRKEIRSDGKILKEIDYSTGKPVVTINKPVSIFLVNHSILVFLIVFVPLFLRIPINSRIYKQEGYTLRGMEGRIATTFTFWWVNYKPENRTLAIANNTLSVIGLSVLVTMIICIPFLGL